MWLVVGLGNPGREYEATRHNVGFMVLEELMRRHRADAAKAKFGGEIAACEISAGGRSEKALLLKPLEYMNLSGRAVQRTAAFYQVPPGSWVVAHDDIDLEFGRLQVKAGGGHGGHNGIRSIIQDAGTSEFQRVRIGVGRPGAGREAAAHVLGGFSRAEDKELPFVIGDAADAIETLILQGTAAAMNRFNVRKKV